MIRLFFAMTASYLILLAASLLSAGEPDKKPAEPITFSATDWPWWRGPNRNGIAAAEQKPPMTWSESENVLGKSPVIGRGHGSPTIVGDQVFLAAADHGREIQSVLCFHRGTGERLWQADVHEGGFPKGGNSKSSLASSTVACDGQRVFVNFLNAGAIYTTALSRDGKQLWQTKITDYVLPQGFGWSPAVFQSLVIVSADNKGTGAIAGLDRATGRIEWKQTGMLPAATPRLPRDNLLVFRGSNNEPLPVKTTDDWLKRRAEIVRGAQVVMGVLPGREKRCPLDMKVEEEVDRGSYVRRFITYASEPGSRVPAYLCIPKAALSDKDNPAPAVLCLHGTDNVVGHGVVVGLGDRPNRQYASELAERGYVTLAPNYPLLAKYQPDIKALGWQSGTLKAVWDNMRGLDLLESMPFVKPEAFGAIGHSLGGHNAVYTSVFDERIQAVVSSCGLDSYLDYYNGDEKNWYPEKGWCQTRYMLRLADYRGRLPEIPFDFHELIGALAPRHMLIIAPLKDHNFQAASVDRIAAAASEVYQLYGQPTRLRVVHPDCDHDFPAEMRETAYKLFDGVLK